MWPLGHVAIAYLCYVVATRARFDASPAHFPIPVLFLVVGSQFPDLVDKPLAWYLGVIPTGRTLAHSLLLLVPLSVAVYFVATRYDRRECGIAFAIGALSHSIVDAVPALWGVTESATHLLWPITSVEEYEQGPPTVLGLLQDSLTDPYFLSEFVFAAVAFVLWRRHGYPGLGAVRTALERVRPAAN
ncbi:metal-dependent hydrolase [Natronolimnohabitans innermongolicus]|uniref:Membrane-bound metal-dependent hydrolase n=1 Tax=Natronolimnohabitans innermongolicus JCM 12255 TaxID=1227499 RepID=L9XH97_9EURY|nr:metal-dependent hydrolase [Natronolimnohabitans innermongolicus]ELY61080.1 membrane-bound metal-dependent hydrolase [Natronolimnohabitans innermongolicus JCM 12255]